MSQLANEVIDDFINALQISINSEIIKAQYLNRSMNIEFARIPLEQIVKDKSLKCFVKITASYWSKEYTLTIINMEPSDIALWKDFLLLTRLKTENINAILEKDHRFKKLIRNFPDVLKEPKAETILFDLPRVSGEISKAMKEKSMTIRELAGKTGLSMVAISNFRSGKDIRLSNFIKIAEALGLKLKLE